MTQTTRLPLPEPVDYQIRLAGGRWTHCAKHIHEAAIKSGAAETRALYSADQMISFRAADNAALRAEVERLREALRIVRLYPDFDEGGPLADMMDDVLSGKETPTLQLMDSLEQQGLLAARKAAP